MTREEHLEYAKERALEYLPADAQMAVDSFISDLNNHPELRGHAVIELIGLHMVTGLLNERTARDFITGTT